VNAFWRISFDLTFPNNEYIPTARNESRDFSLIPFLVFQKFLNPELGMRLGNAQCTIRASVPKAAVDKNCFFLCRKCDVGSSRCTFPVEPIPPYTICPEA
jgi:hypothetical protein